MAKTNETLNKPLKKRKKSLPDFAAWAQSFLQTIENTTTSKQSGDEALSCKGSLTMVSLPIGNLGDITLRALWSLSQADAILCEDTRVTGGLLHLYGIKKPLVTCHEHNEESRIKEVLSRLAAGENLAFVSDAGTPVISDPGFWIVRACRQAGIAVTATPGACALLTALVCAGLPSDRFLFVGFLPNKKTARCKHLSSLASVPVTMIFYESAQRLTAALRDMAETLGANREAVMARELTKLYEEFQSGTLGDLANHFADHNAPKGEIVILVGGADKNDGPDEIDIDAALQDALKTMSLRDAVAFVTKETGLKKSAVYARALALTD